MAISIHNFLPVGFKPTLAAKTDDKKLAEHFAAGGHGYGSYKFDGVRCIGADGNPFSRSGKIFRNKFLQHEFKRLATDVEFKDGELIVGDPNDPDVYRITDAAMKTIEGEPDFRFYAFDDLTDMQAPYHERLALLQPSERIIIVEQRPIVSMAQMVALEEEALELNYEGAMYRKFDGHYRFDRSTAVEMCLMKLKRDEDMELVVIGFEEAMHNGNEAFKDAYGRTVRTSHQENKTGLGRVGKFLVVYNGLLLKVAPGKFKHKELEEIWNNQHKYLGQLLKFRYFPHGMKDLPRHPRALGWRDPIDT